MIVFFACVIWFWLLITVFADLFRRHDIGGGMKTLWIIFVILLPFLGVFIYLISQGKGMAERNWQSMQAAQAQQADYIKSVASSRRRGRRDRQGEEAARLRRHHAGRVRRHQGQGARYVSTTLVPGGLTASGDSRPGGNL